jgi:hypothetical protein
MLHRVAAVCFALRLPLFEITRVLVRIDHAAFSILKWFLTPVVDMFGICTGPLTSLRTRSSLPPLLPDHLAAGDSIYLDARRGCSPYPRLPCNTVSKVSGRQGFNALVHSGKGHVFSAVFPRRVFEMRDRSAEGPRADQALKMPA